MPGPNDVNGADSSAAVDDRGVPLQNLQAEMSRKLEAMETKWAERLDSISQKLDSFSTEPEPVADPQTINEREELTKISASPRRYVENIVQPLRDENKLLREKLEKNEKLTVYGLWEREQDRIARLEGKNDWDQLPAKDQADIVNIVKERNWVNDPARAKDAYEIFRARKITTEASDPDRLARISAGTTEGSGRVSGKTPVRTIARSSLEQLGSTHPKHPDYKKNMDTLDRVQRGEIKVE